MTCRSVSDMTGWFVSYATCESISNVTCGSVSDVTCGSLSDATCRSVSDVTCGYVWVCLLYVTRRTVSDVTSLRNESIQCSSFNIYRYIIFSENRKLCNYFTCIYVVYCVKLQQILHLFGFLICFMYYIVWNLDRIT